MVGGQLFNKGFVGQDFYWWVGQIADDSYWRDNILSGKFESAESIPGWGYRYKVRIFGLHDLGEEVIKSENLPWANVMYPITAGAYLQNSGQTPMIRQGNIVFGFFLDGTARQQPVIMGCLGNNSQTDLATTIGDNRVTNTTSGKSVGVSGYSVGNKDYPGQSNPTKNDGNMKVDKPTSKENEKERAKPSPGTGLNQYGLPADRPITPAQQKDIDSARSEAQERNLSKEDTDKLIRKRVKAGVSARVKEANSPRAKVTGQPFMEAEATMRQSIADIKRDKVYCEKRVLLKPDNIVESANKAMQTDMDNLVQNLDKAMNALQSYTDAASMTDGIRDVKKMIADSSKRQSKYMKIVMDKCMEYTEKALNKEMTKAVSALPAMDRMNFLEVKDGISQNLLSSYNGMTGGQAGLMEGIMNKVLNIDNLMDQFASAAADDTSSGGDGEKLKGKPKVPMCTSEDMIATVLSVNKTAMQDTSDNIISGVDGFLRDAFSNMAGLSGSATNMFNKLGNIKGSLTSALSFENIKMNVFPFEEKPNEAVSDFYTLCSGGGGAEQTSLPSTNAIDKASIKHIGKIDAINELYPGEGVDGFMKQQGIKIAEQTAFSEPTKNTPDVDLTGGGSQEADIAEALEDNAAQEAEFNMF
tara:strand:- start:6387 stop:8309 length:1923 start_codon:yes stop_codon:yes gene_type:complete